MSPFLGRASRLPRRRLCAIRAARASQPLVQWFFGLWTTQLARLAAHGDRGAYLAFARVYHQMAAPAMLFHPSLAFLLAGLPYEACQSRIRGPARWTR
ncbi:MAG: hypothetical protein WAN44_08795 [Propionibacteriaceae bacterium]